MGAGQDVDVVWWLDGVNAEEAFRPRPRPSTPIGSAIGDDAGAWALPEQHDPKGAEDALTVCVYASGEVEDVFVTPGAHHDLTLGPAGKLAWLQAAPRTDDGLGQVCGDEGVVRDSEGGLVVVSPPGTTCRSRRAGCGTEASTGTASTGATPTDSSGVQTAGATRSPWEAWPGSSSSTK